MNFLENGDRLSQTIFHRRYSAMPDKVRAELIGGIVYMASPLKPEHGKSGARVIQWLAEYELATPGTELMENTTNILGPTSEAQPDACLLLSPEKGGQTWIDKKGFLNGAPELIVEVSTSTESIDLHGKKENYRAAGVQEYIVVALKKRHVFWFMRRRNKFREQVAGADGIYRSEVFPGLWLDAAALLRRDGRRVMSTLRQGLESEEHQAFVAKLEKT